MQADDTSKNKTDTSSGSPPSTDQYLASLYAYQEQIDQLSKLFYVTPQLELISDHATLSTINVQLADIIHNMETMGGNPLGKRFNKKAVLKYLNNARVELNTALLLAGTSDQQTSVLSFQHLVKCRDSLALAKSLIPASTSS